MNKTPQCLLDMDGVIADFIGGAIDWFAVNQIDFNKRERPLPYAWIFEHCGHTKASFWANTDEDFWANLPWMPDGQELVAVVEHHFGSDNVCILSNPSGLPGAITGKMRWLAKHLPHYLQRCLFGSGKHFCASFASVLIDDADHNVEEFGKHGGHAILVPRPWNSLHGVTNPIEHIIEQIRLFRGAHNGSE